MMGRPNVALVVVDTARAMEAPPADRTVMPTLADIATEGTAFGNAYACAPWTLPSHASLFTGLYPSEHGAHGDSIVLRDSLRRLPEAFADAGYETVAVSNNTWITPAFGFDSGFETFRKGWQYVQSDNDVGAVVRAEQPLAKLRAAAGTLFDGNPAVNALNILYSEFGQPTGDDGAVRTTDYVESWLASRTDSRPFFLFANYIEPHIEYRPPREYAEPFLPDGASFESALAVRQAPQAHNAGVYDLTEHERELLAALYRGELRYVDEHIGRLRQALQDAGEWEETILVVVSDHGENVGEDGILGHQYTLRDTLVNVPLVVHGGAFSRDPGPSERPVQLLDLAPTLLDAAGLDAADLRDQSRGRSFHPSAIDRREVVFAEHVAPRPAVGTLRERFGEVSERLQAFDPPLRSARTVDRALVRDASGRERLSEIGAAPGDPPTPPVSDGAVDLRKRLDEWVASLDPTADASETTVSESTEARLADLGYM